MHLNFKSQQKQFEKLSLKRIFSIAICLFLSNVAANAQKIRPGYEANPNGAIQPIQASENSVKPSDADRNYFSTKIFSCGYTR